MYDNSLLIERLTSILESLQRIPRRFADITKPSDFTDSEPGVDRMDAICMILVVVGEEFKTIDRKTQGDLLSRYHNVHWRGVIGVRDFLAHGYFQVNTEQLFGICRDDIPILIETVKRMIQDLTNGPA